MVTTIQLDETVKKQLDNLKVHSRETYNELVQRLIDEYGAGDKESLIETIEILSDPEQMRALAEGLEDFKKGRFKTLEQVEQELGMAN